MFPVRGVNQILRGTLCKSVDTCAKFLPSARSSSLTAARYPLVSQVKKLPHLTELFVARIEQFPDGLI